MSNKQIDVFLHNYANAMRNIKRLEGPLLFVLGDSGRYNYFPTSTPSKRTTHHHS